MKPTPRQVGQTRLSFMWALVLGRTSTWSVHGLQVDPLDGRDCKGSHNDHLLTELLGRPRPEDCPAVVLRDVGDPVVARVDAVVVRTPPKAVLFLTFGG